MNQYGITIQKLNHRSTDSKRADSAETSGDELTYKILTEQKGKRGIVLVQSIAKSRRKNIGKDNKYVNDDPKYADFFLHPIVTTVDPNKVDATTNLPSWSGEEQAIKQPIIDMIEWPKLIIDNERLTFDDNEDNNDNENDDQNEHEHPDQPDDKLDDGIMDSFAREDDLTHENMSFIKIVDHNWVEGELHFTTQFGNNDHQTALSIPFGIIKKDKPFATAKYILDEIVGTKSNDRPHHPRQLYKEETIMQPQQGSHDQIRYQSASKCQTSSPIWQREW